MKKYTVQISIYAFNDIENLRFAISEIFKSPRTAVVYVEELRKEINFLAISADSLPVSTLNSVTKYGHNARRINYKKMSIVFTIHNDIVLIHRVIPASMFTE